MELEELKVYKISLKLGEDLWNIVIKWNYFEKDTVGKQLIRASDSIAANISEGFGRYNYKEALNFYYYSRGSLYETKTWLNKSHNRGLIETDTYKTLIMQVNTLAKMLNAYINSIGKTKSK